MFFIITTDKKQADTFCCVWVSLSAEKKLDREEACFEAIVCERLSINPSLTILRSVDFTLPHRPHNHWGASRPPQPPWFSRGVAPDPWAWIAPNMSPVGHAWYMYYDHRTCMYCDHSTCVYFHHFQGLEVSVPKTSLGPKSIKSNKNPPKLVWARNRSNPTKLHPI